MPGRTRNGSLTSSLEKSIEKGAGATVSIELPSVHEHETQEFRLYRQRFYGLAAWFLLAFASGMCWPWFGPIANDTAKEFNFTLTQVTWLGNIFSAVYVPTAIAVPMLCHRFGLRRCAEIGAACLVISAWVRYAGTSKSLSPGSAYTLMFLGQLLAAIAQPIFQILGPKYSETWFNLNGRTTATTVLSVANPVGGAIGQLISPFGGGPRESVLILGIICTAIAPTFLFVRAAPPTPPTYSGSQKSPTLQSLVRAWFGFETPAQAHMSLRERIDFTIVFCVFGVLVGASNAFSVLSNQYLEPVGYDADTSGLMGATLLLAGLVFALIAGPIIDRVLTHRLALMAKVLTTISAIGWFSLIWAVRPDNTSALFAVLAVIGLASVPLLPIGLELAIEVTRNAGASSGLLWGAGNLVALVFMLSEDALRAPASASPPLNMKTALTFQGAVVLAICVSVFGIHGRQLRRERDEDKSRETNFGMRDRANAEAAADV